MNLNKLPVPIADKSNPLFNTVLPVISTIKSPAFTNDASAPPFTVNPFAVIIISPSGFRLVIAPPTVILAVLPASWVIFILPALEISPPTFKFPPRFISISPPTVPAPEPSPVIPFCSVPLTFIASDASDTPLAVKLTVPAPPDIKFPSTVILFALTDISFSAPVSTLSAISFPTEISKFPLTESALTSLMFNAPAALIEPNEILSMGWSSLFWIYNLYPSLTVSAPATLILPDELTV